ncbi:unnamed protein product [Aphis gossypii]|uniref:HTH OST-type domain-containing protein n=1 Tax=Aphis gossypii TaxID=80765 RepID=A0A9P0J6R1_APHGO|nr:unnamed protein product [Aphis gossypii]
MHFACFGLKEIQTTHLFTCSLSQHRDYPRPGLDSIVFNICTMEQPDLNYLKMVIRSILTSSPGKVTISQISSDYSNFEGCNLSFEHLGFKTIYELLENMSDVLRIPQNPNMNSFVTLIVDEKTSHLRELVVNQKTKKQRPKKNISTLRSSNNHLPTSANYKFCVNNLDNQRNEYTISTTHKYSTPRYATNARGSVKSIDSYEMYDSDTVLDTMKVKMRRILSKHKDGILCNDFMDIYGKEYYSHFNFFEYGFRSMRDMAYKLPSVFYVKVTDDDNDCILFEADRRSELENNLEDPSLYYKNIPKTILYNLSHFFNKHWNGVKFNELMSLYCAEYGRAYEPLKYGYSSEKHMFESLDKMVEIENNQLFTIDPFAYAECFKNKNVDVINHQDNSSIVLLMADDFLLHYTGKDICNGKFRYSKIKLNDQKVAKIIVSEVYNPSSFYIQLEAEVNNLNKFMDTLQEYYEKNEEKYKVIPRLILPELPCASCYEDSNLWLRAMVLNIVDEENVKVTKIFIRL